jgi:hypothetical protein
MAVSVSKDTSFSTGAISFSALRLKFKRVSSGAVSLSELKRQDSVSLTSPTVPDATENSNIPTTNSNIQLSGYRGSITYYYLYQSGTNTNLNISSQSWNSNLGRNVPKQFIINGTLGATSTSNHAAYFNATAYNLSISVGGSGYILGAGGAGGTPSSPNGGNGGPALDVISTGGKINLYGTSRILAGGGGGGAGATGGTGGKGGQAFGGQIGGSGGSGGAGGNGGKGQGYNQSKTNGSLGSNGNGGDLGSFGGGKGGDGGQGGTGGDGGDWGKDGTGGGESSKGKGGESAVYGLYYQVLYDNSTSIFDYEREAIRQSTISIPGIGDFTLEEDYSENTITKSNLSKGFYGVITGKENNPPDQPPTPDEWVIIKRTQLNQIGLDDNQGKKPDGDYDDLLVTQRVGQGLFGNYSPPGSPAPNAPTNYGSGGNAGTKISGSNYIIRT